ncbi:MAG: UDP-3-O-acyl-N-acetylglucosamine deacetylase [Deltaproteobacteria bacterium]|nr:UDP-3-O-acyl-N-acetylglucosamine deacetylase [Deltaproteobacteria bacterium]
MNQKTLKQSCEIRGKGLHSGKEAHITLLPAPANHGIVFRLSQQGRQLDIPASADCVTRTMLSTNLGRDGLEVRTVEHLMSALTGMEIDNAMVVVDGCEVPVMDGSAEPFARHIQQAGIKTQSAPRRYLRVLEPLELIENDKKAGLYPSATPVYSFHIDFTHPAIQIQSHSIALTPKTFMDQVARARTFGFEEDLHNLQNQGLALGAGLDNAVALGRDGTVLNQDGLRYPDEFVRHKLLDAIGDLALGGMALLAEYRGVKSGHALNLKLIQTLAAQPEKWEIVTPMGFPQSQAG